MAEKTFGSLPRAKGKHPEDAAQLLQIATTFQCSDITTPVALVSPLNFLAAGATNIKIPHNAGEITLRPTVDMRVSIEDATCATRYFVILANAERTLGVAGDDVDNIYIRGNAANGILHFSFNII